jgi:predicted DNA-binding protein
MKVQVSIHLDEQTHNEIVALAKKEGRSLSNMIRFIIDKGMSCYRVVEPFQQ